MRQDMPEPRGRVLTGPARWTQVAVFSLIPVLGLLFVLKVHVHLGLAFYGQQWSGALLTLLLVATFLTMPARRGTGEHGLPWYDLVLCLLSLPAGLWIAVRYPNVINTLGQAGPERLVMGGLAILLVLEAVRRTAGWSLVAVAGIFLLYGRFSSYLPQSLAGLPMTWTDLVNYIYLDSNSMLFMLNLAATYAIAFSFLGQVLLSFGGSEALTDLSLVLFGQVRGGPAKVAVLGSSLVGSMTGGAVNNVFLTGSVTIPLMIRTGYPRPLAGAVEAVASSGGQVLPPVMGIAAFLIAERLQISYAEVALAAFLPALLCYLAVFIQVDLEAGKHGLHGLPRSALPKLKPVLARVWPVFLAIGFLVYTMFIIRLTPASAAVYSGVVGMICLALHPENRQGFWRRLVDAVVGTGRTLMDLAGILAAAGIVMGVVAVSGLGFTFGYTISRLGESHVLLLLLAAAVGSFVLGMGLPAVAVYALVAVLVEPALVQFGIDPLLANLFIFYFGIAASFTPPVGGASFAAAALAGAPPMRTGWVATRLGVLIYVLPFLFVFSPTLILRGSPLWILVSIATAVAGTFALGAGLVGYVFWPVPWQHRVLLLVAGILLMIPNRGLNLIVIGLNLAGLLLGCLALWADANRRTRPQNQETGTAASTSERVPMEGTDT